MEQRPQSIADILRKKPEATVGDFPVPKKEHTPVDKEEINRMHNDINNQIQKLETDYQEMFIKMSNHFPENKDILSMIDDLDPTGTIIKLRKVQYELETILIR